MPLQGSDDRPSRRGELRGPAARAAWLAERRALGADTARILARASAARAEEEALQPKAPPGAPGSRNWTPIGPSAVGQGQAAGRPVVSGRVVGIEVAPGANRAYAGVADGGLWRWTRDPAAVPPTERWEPQDDFIVTAGAAPGVAANALSVGDIAVAFGANADADLIFVATGEAVSAAWAGGAGAPGGVGGQYAGVGVRVSQPRGILPARVWTLEATNLLGAATYRIVIDPDNNQIAWVAATTGLFRRPAAGAPIWPQVGTGGASPLPVGGTLTDVVIGGSTAAGNKTIWVAVDDVGVFNSTDNGATWNAVAGIPAAPGNLPGRISLALDPATPTVVYAFEERGGLYRVDTAAAPGFLAVQRLPTAPTIFGLNLPATPGQGWYDIAVAVAPGNVNRVYIIGATVQSARTGSWEWELAAFRGDLALVGGNWRFGFTAANDTRDRANQDGTYIGQGIHADGHCITFGRNAAGNLDPTDVWIGCDGGVFRSTTSGNRGTFTALNTGMSSIQLTYLDQHPTHDSVVVAGCQDNGVVRHLGDATWLEDPKGDGGGVAVDPNHPWRMMAQGNGNRFFRTTNAGNEWRAFALPIVAPPAERVAFYAQICAAPRGAGPFPPPPAIPAPAGAAIPTHRVWASFDWGATWVTLPTNAAPPAGNVAQDSLDGTRIMALAWPTATRIYAATATRVFRIDFNAVAGTWATTALGGPAPIGPPLGPITDLAVANPANDDIYVSLGGNSEHVFWLDGPAGNVWRATNTLAAFNAPAHAIAVDPSNSNDVYVGTDVGVFFARHVPALGPPAPAPDRWPWALLSPGLPEAAVIDLRTQAANRLLRAATHGRGAWELQLGVVAGADPDLFLRMNPADTGRRRPASASTPDPTFIHPDGTQVTVDWGDSPDIKVRRGIAAQAAPAFAGRTLRLRTPPRMTGADVRRWQRHAIRRGFNLGPLGADGDFGPSSDLAAHAAQRRYGLVDWNAGPVTDGQVGARTWAATTSYPALPAVLDHRAFTLDVREDVDDGTRVQIGDATGVNRVFLQLHGRGALTVAPAQVRALLLAARLDGAGNAPNLPADWAARTAAADATAWLGATGWVFADGATPYRSPTLPLTSREPRIVEWPVDFAALGFAAGDVVVLLAALTATAAAPAPADVIANAEVRVRQLVAAERRIAARRVRLDAVAVIP